MKQSVKTIVEAVEKEIETIIYNAERQDYGIEKEFDYGSFIYDVSYNEGSGKYSDDWDVSFKNIIIEVKSVTVTNENSKTLTNLSNEVFNQLELTYTNY